MSKFPRVAVLIGSLVMGDGPLPAQSASVQATCGSVSIGRDVSGSTVAVGGVVCGIPPEKLEELIRDKTRDLQDLSGTQRELIQRLRQDLDLNQRQVRMALEIVGEAHTPPERLAAKLVEVAERFKALSVGAATQPGDDLRVRALKADAQTAVEEGDLVRADQLLAEAEAAEVTVIERLALNAAETAAQRGRVALTRLHYMEAAQHFATAAARVPNHHGDKRLGYLKQEASALFQQGDERGDIDAAQAAISRYRQIGLLWSRTSAPLEWAIAQRQLGVAILSLGERENGNARLKEAEGVFRAALDELRQDDTPLQWADTQANLGGALRRLGERERSITYLKEAVNAFSLALQVYTPERAPEHWAAATTNLGSALVDLGVWGEEAESLRKAVNAFRAALQEYNRERAPYDWALVQNNLSNALRALGTKEGATAILHEAVNAARAALEEHTRNRVPIKWANTQFSLGHALAALGEQEDGSVHLAEAVSAYRAAMEVSTRERDVYSWTRGQLNLGDTLRRLGERGRSIRYLEEALDAYRLALEEYSREQTPKDWAHAQHNLCVTLSALGKQESGTLRLKEADSACRSALDVYTRADVPLDWARTQHNLGSTLIYLGARESGTRYLEDAVEAFLAALQVRTPESQPKDWANTQNGLDTALLHLSVRQLKVGQWGEGRQSVARIGGKTINTTAILLSAWTYAGTGDSRGAFDTLSRLQGTRNSTFRDFHSGLIAELLGDQAEAERGLTATYVADRNTLRIADAYARFRANTGSTNLAIQVYTDLDKLLPRHPVVRDALDRLKAGKPLARLINTAQEGAGEVLYGLGSAASTQGDWFPAVVYLQLALDLAPEHTLAHLNLAEIFERLKQFEQANEAYAQIPVASPLKLNADIQIGLNLEQMGKYEEALAHLATVMKTYPYNIDVITALGNVQRSRKKYAEAAETYTTAIELIGDRPVEDYWTVFYYRGIAYEQSNQWLKAEDDLKKALRFVPPSQLGAKAQVLNYIAYNWVDKNVNLDEALRMLKQAVILSPSDGHIIDSLGWAYYRLGFWNDAVRELEKAVELAPDEQAINDHLGDAYWRVGRHSEAHTKWRRAKELSKNLVP